MAARGNADPVRESRLCRQSLHLQWLGSGRLNMMGSTKTGDWTWTVWQGRQALSPLNREPVVLSTVQHEDRMLKPIELRPERLLEIIGEDLMLGADHARIVERLSVHGIPATPDVLA